MLTKHTSPFAVYVSYVGRDHLHTLVEECETLEQAHELKNLYTDDVCITYIVDGEGKIIDKF